MTVQEDGTGKKRNADFTCENRSQETGDRRKTYFNNSLSNRLLVSSFRQMTDRRTNDLIINQTTKRNFMTNNFQTNNTASGKVYIVGAGTGDAELITVKALKLIQQADVILYDALLPQSLLSESKRLAELIFVGKRAEKHYQTQNQINDKLIAHAKSGKLVVRLKGGDPLIFGRGSEEALALSQAGIPFEIIPGISALQTCSSYSSIPLTHRGVSRSFMAISGDEQSMNEIDFKWLGQYKGTLVFFMARKTFLTISSQLIQSGMKRDTPLAVIENGGYDDQVVHTATLSTAYEISPSQDAAVLVIIGETVNYHAILSQTKQEADYALSHVYEA